MSISSTLNAQIFCTNVVLAAFSSYMYVVKAAETTFVWKIRTFDIDEIDHRSNPRHCLIPALHLNSSILHNYVWFFLWHGLNLHQGKDLLSHNGVPNVPREIGWTLPQKETSFFNFPQYSMKMVTILGDDVTVHRGVLSREHRAYVVNSKSIFELLTLYYYKISFLTTF